MSSIGHNMYWEHNNSSYMIYLPYHWKRPHYAVLIAGSTRSRDLPSFKSRMLWSPRVLRRFNCVSIVMFCVLVRHSMNMDPAYPNRVAACAFERTQTFVDFSCHDAKRAKAIASSLGLMSHSLITSDELVSTWSTTNPPSAVLARLLQVGFSIVAANTVGVTTVWTLQCSPNVRS